MTFRGLYLADGTSDQPIARHLRTLFIGCGVDVEIVQVPSDRIGHGPVRDRIEVVLAEDPAFDIVLVHRDSESQDPAPRYREVVEGAAAAGFDGSVVAVVPVRMTEAWLLLNEGAIREVAGKPTGTVPLGLPTPAEAERLADPKALLQDALVRASETAGRRRKVFQRQFPSHRRTLIERLDIAGSIQLLSSWKQLQQDINNVAAGL
jgi:hypothetical protein